MNDIYSLNLHESIAFGNLTIDRVDGGFIYHKNHGDSVTSVFVPYKGEFEKKIKSERNNIPYQKIISMYHEILPELPKVEKLTQKRKTQIKSRWTEDLPQLKNWSNYFNFIRKNDFLMGRIDPQPGRRRFIADLEWLTNTNNFAKIAEDKYLNEEIRPRS